MFFSWAGNEIQEPGDRLLPGHIRDSNRITILSLLKEYSRCATGGVGHISDSNRITILSLLKEQVRHRGLPH